MNAEPSTDPAIERLNYRNGQRMVATDLRAEQAYHIGVRRWLNRTLFNPGIAKGLEVTPSTTDPHKVNVSPGLAIDFQGRELIIADPVEFYVSGVPSTTPGTVFGNYLVIEFQEERGAPGGVVCSDDSAPTRILSIPRLSVQSAWPTTESGRLPLAQIELTADCRVARVHTAIRKYASTSKPPKVRSISIEGEKDVTPTDPKVLYFHIANGYPDSVTLYLRGSRFSTFHYGEVGWHGHGQGGTVGTTTKDLTHTHGATGGGVTAAGGHTHSYFTDNGEDHGGIDVNDAQVVGRINTDTSAIVPVPDHDHQVQNLIISAGLAPWGHDHTLSGASAAAGTNATQGMRIGAAFDHFSDLQVALDGTDITPQLLTQIQGRRPAEDWSHLGTGLANHPVVVSGSGEVDLLQIADLGPGQHYLDFRPASGGGQLHYNLYVE